MLSSSSSWGDSEAIVESCGRYEEMTLERGGEKKPEDERQFHHGVPMRIVIALT